ncbi:MAG: 50S ribosomal protein L9 [Clostridiales bacterium]|nr:50S ribosomal protein L9 [Clostridiales bacterium]
MKVILLQDIPGTGKKNQILNVSDGYARNYLLPRKWAIQANESSVKEIERRNEAERQREFERRKEAEDLADSLKDKTIVLHAKCGEKGRLYGSVTTQEIAAALQQQHGLNIDKRKLELNEAVRTIGDYEVQISIYTGIKASMKVSVIAAE